VELRKRLLAASALISVCACHGKVLEPPTSHVDAAAALASDAACGPVDAALDGPLPDACAGLLSCCAFLPQVFLPECQYVGRGQQMSEETLAATCAGEMSSYVEQGYLDGGPCTGVGNGASACASLGNCCDGFDVADSGCREIAAAGNQCVCTEEFYLLSRVSGDCTP
jgi:hypothetical protein